MFSYHAMGCLHKGQCERGISRLKAGLSGHSRPCRSAHSTCHWACSMVGTRQITTFKKLPTNSPSTPRAAVARGAAWVSAKQPSCRISKFHEDDSISISISCKLIVQHGCGDRNDAKLPRPSVPTQTAQGCGQSAQQRRGGFV